MIEARLTLARRDFVLEVALALPSQGVSALFGPSGCGKTTLLRALAGLERATGRVALNGQIWQDDAAGAVFVPTHQRPIGYVIQEAALFPHLDVRRNLDYGQRRIAPAERHIALDQAVELLGIGALMERRPATLSGGERQRVAIARALATSPRLLLMDEPLAALDAARKAEILPYLERLHRAMALPIVYVTHALDEVARLADHLVLLQAGCVLAEGGVADLFARTDLPLGRQDEAGAVLEATVAAHDLPYGLTRIAVSGGSLWLGAVEQPPGTPVRVRVLARDVSIARDAPQHSSILNVLPVTLERLEAEGRTVLLRLRLGGRGDPAAATLLARITRRSVDTLGLQPGDRLHAQIKGVALMG
ncbi:molybdenum ABC transporter ATP-binding protein [Sphaerotilus sp.]|uniref:molybdenum ABC transporter ATP-binding protein n=1 Tax=Sphaerotilus sp. TaxID=2093942 RepID=UPI002ACE7207|nr:molybdenum ABC transporter ATP-binding protein [Sphaerotilus sp.]MDZ7857893.1 molybdenum ABC transporter ATP-binding protein [Sphaerotilus sp.]